MKLESYKDVQDMLTTFVKSQGVPISTSPHASFWNSLTYAQFTTAVVPNVPDPNNPAGGLRILIPGNSKQSNIIMALSGTGPDFNPNDGAIGPMPPSPPPALPPEQIAALADWIDRNCPEGPAPAKP